MYTILSSEDIVDIVLFFNKNGIGSNPNYVVCSYNALADFEIRRLRSLFFNYKIIGYGDVIEEDGEKHIKDLILYTRSSSTNATHIYLSLAPINNPDFIMFTMSDIMEKNSDIQKIRAVTSQKALDRGFQKTWESAGLKFELQLREFENPENNIVSYSFIKER